MPHPYTVALQDAGDLPSAQRIAAETRFASAIERTLGGAEAVAQVYRAWTVSAESEASQVDQATAQAAVRWPRAYETAVQSGFRNLGEFPGAHFEVRLERNGAAAGP